MLYNVKGPTNTAKPDDEEGLPWWWDGFWALPFTESGEPGTEAPTGQAREHARARSGPNRAERCVRESLTASCCASGDG